jgi:hypothetical protein
METIVIGNGKKFPRLVYTCVMKRWFLEVFYINLSGNRYWNTNINCMFKHLLLNSLHFQIWRFLYNYGLFNVLLIMYCIDPASQVYATFNGLGMPIGLKVSDELAAKVWIHI